MPRGRRHGVGFRLRQSADIMTQFAQQLGKKFADEQIIFHQKNPEPVHNPCTTRLGQLMCRNLG